ncbi:MAG: glutamate-cysteine ligase family protein [Planctomycetota bacterium]|jgi:CBS domain-containing protein
MGTQVIHDTSEGEQYRANMALLLEDLRALERMLDEGLFESDVRRIGVEQEMALVDRQWLPSPMAMEVLEALNEPSLTTELARFNLECNSHPCELTGDCFDRLEDEIRTILSRVREAGREFGCREILTGILPTIGLEDLHRGNISPRERYFLIDRLIREMRGEHYELHIKGIDDLRVRHDSIMVEALNTSFQVHLQVAPEEFAAMYNIALLSAGPLMAVCGNSPVLFGKRLWKETRIAIFEQAVDTRTNEPYLRDMPTRVRFGERWVKESVLELYRDDASRFRMLFAPDETEDPRALLDEGQIPRLHALQTHNSTSYRWMRPCYGIGGGKPHLRIENRILPAGPTLVDEIANSAFWIGMMLGGAREWGDVRKRIDFDTARSNFLVAARLGIDARLGWLDETTFNAQSLVLEQLLPLARAGLEGASVDSRSIDRLLGIIEQRVTSGHTGSWWMLKSASSMRESSTRGERLVCLTAGISKRQDTGEPVHTWSLANLDDGGSVRARCERVGQIMSTDLFTVHEDELLDLVTSIMEWERIRHIPVEDDQRRLVGLVTYRTLLRLMSSGQHSTQVRIGDVMIQNPVTVTPQTRTMDALDLMRTGGHSALPVVQDDRLVGIVTEHDFMRVAGELLEQQLKDTEEDGAHA